MSRDGAVLIGRRAIEAYVDGVPGRLMRSLKSVLGTALIDETTRVGRERSSFRDVIAYYLGAVKRRAEQAAGQEFRNVVHGRPVHFVDNAPDADRKAEADAARRSSVRSASMTSRFSSSRSPPRWTTSARSPRGDRADRRHRRRHIRLLDRASQPRASPQGGSRRATFSPMTACGSAARISTGGSASACVMPLFGYGSAMKRAGLDAPSSYFHDLATWSSINRMYEPRVTSDIRQVRQEAERAGTVRPPACACWKSSAATRWRWRSSMRRSHCRKARKPSFSLEWVEPGLSIAISRADLVGHTKELAARIGGADQDLPRTGGAHRRRHRRGVSDGRFGAARACATCHRGAVPAAQVIEGDTFGAVGKGLTIEAARRYGGSS